MGNEEIINILTNFEGDFIIGNIMTYCLRMFGWLIIQGLSKLSDAMELITDTMYSLNNFFDSEGVKEIINLFKPVLFVILGLSIVYIGYKLITDREFKGSKVINNITLSVMVIMLLPTLMIKLNEATQYGISAIKSKGGIEVSTSAEQLIKSNLTDLYYLDSKNFKIDNNDNKNNIPIENIKDININEEVDDKKVNNKEVFKNKVTLDENGKKDLEKLEKEFFGLSQEKYFRYDFNFWIISISLLCLILVFLLTSIKVARLVYELAFVKIFAIFYAFADIGSGQGIKQILKHILSVFAVIFSTSILIKLYLLFNGFVSNQSDLNMFAKIVFLIGGSIAVIDAPNIVERIFGIDAGLKSAWGVVAGAYSTVKATNELGKVGSNVGSSIVSAGGGAKGIANGFFGLGNEDGKGNTKPLEEQIDKVSNTSPNPLEDEDNTKSSESVNMADNISSLDENKNISERGSRVNDSLDNNDTLDNNDINGSEISSLSQNSDIGENYGARNSLSEDIESKDISNGNIDDTQSPNSNTGTINDNTSSSDISSLESQMSKESPTIGENIDSNLNNPSKLEDVSHIKPDSNINPNNINKDNKSNISNEHKGNISKEDKPIETRTYSDYAKDRISNSNTMQRVNRHYQLGQNTGIKLRQKFDRKVDSRIQRMKDTQAHRR